MHSWNTQRAELSVGLSTDHLILWLPTFFQKEKYQMWTIIIILFVLWLLGFFGGRVIPSFPKTGSWIHVLIVVAVILIILNLLGVI